MSGGEGGPPRWGKISEMLGKLDREPGDPDIDCDKNVVDIPHVKVDRRKRKPGLGKAKITWVTKHEEARRWNEPSDKDDVENLL